MHENVREQHVSNNPIISEILILQILGEMNLKTKRGMLLFFSLKNLYKENPLSVLSYCINWVGKKLDNQSSNTECVQYQKSQYVIFVNFVFTPIQKIYN